MIFKPCPRVKFDTEMAAKQQGLGCRVVLFKASLGGPAGVPDCPGVNLLIAVFPLFYQRGLQRLGGAAAGAGGGVGDSPEYFRNSVQTSLTKPWVSGMGGTSRRWLTRWGPAV